MQREQKAFEVKRLIEGILIGAFLAAFVMLAMCFLGAVLLSQELVPEGAANYMAWIICAVGTLVGCAIAQHKVGSARLPVSLACGVLLLIVMGAVRTILASETQASWYSAAIIGGCAVLSALLGAKQKRRH